MFVTMIPSRKNGRKIYDNPYIYPKSIKLCSNLYIIYPNSRYIKHLKIRQKATFFECLGFRFTIQVEFVIINPYNKFCVGFIVEGGLFMKLALILGVCVTFIISMFTSGYEAKPGVPKNNQ